MAKPEPPVPVPYATLRGLLGKPVDDPAVVAMCALAGKVSVTIVAKEAGFDYALERPANARKAKKVLSTLFLYRDGVDGHRG